MTEIKTIEPTVTVELVHFDGCPNAEEARLNLRTALGPEASWTEWDLADGATPEDRQQHGSPTVLMNGRDVTGDSQGSAAMSCRADGAPDIEVIRSAYAELIVTEDSTDIKAGMDRLLVDGYLKSNPPELQQLILATYQKLAEGTPVTVAELSARTGFETDQVRELWALIPPSAFEYDPSGAITGFIGFSILPSRHELHIAGRKFYTWCAFDALFLPQLIGEPAKILTRCPATAETVEVELNPKQMVSVSPAAAVMSIVSPRAGDYRADLQGAFCCHVNFFVNESAYEKWAAGRADVSQVPLVEAYELALRRNRLRFPDAGHLFARKEATR